MQERQAKQNPDATPDVPVVPPPALNDTTLRAMLDSLTAHIAVVDETGLIVYVNAAWRKFAQENAMPARRGEVGTNYFRLCEKAEGPWSEEARPFLAGMHRVLAGEVERFELEYPCHSPDQKRWFLGRVTRCQMVAGRPCLVVAHDNITQRRLAEEQLQLQSAMLQAAANGIVIADREGKILWVNAAFTKLTGYTPAEACGQNPRVLKSGQHHADFYKKMWDTVLAGEVWRGEVVNRRKDGTFYLEDMTITPVRDAHGQVSHFIAIKQDVSERRTLEESLRQAQKMESVGRLAGGVAHEFNNIMQTVLGYIELLQAAPNQTTEQLNDLAVIQREANRAASLTAQLLSFGRKQMIQPRVLDLNQLLSETENLLRGVLGEDIQVVLQLETELPSLMADVGQLSQVVMNLAVNARDAMPRGGRLTLSTCSCEFQEHDCTGRPEMQPGPFVCLAIADTGCGMSAAVQQHLFEPFFTTKGLGRGTGLGLAVVYGIIKQANGWIHVYSQEGLGTTFKLYLPATGMASSAKASSEVPAAQNQRILLVEDDTGTRSMAVHACRKAGYAISACATRQEALDLWQRHSGSFDVLFSDVVLPDGTGLDLADRFRADRPTLPILLCSAYSDERARWPIIAVKGYHYIQKPYPITQMLHALRAAVAQKPQPGP